MKIIKIHFWQKKNPLLLRILLQRYSSFELLSKTIYYKSIIHNCPELHSLGRSGFIYKKINYIVGSKCT